MVVKVSGSIYRQTELVIFQAGLDTPLIRACTQNPQNVNTPKISEFMRCSNLLDLI